MSINTSQNTLAAFLAEHCAELSFQNHNSLEHLLRLLWLTFSFHKGGKWSFLHAYSRSHKQVNLANVLTISWQFSLFVMNKIQSLLFINSKDFFSIGRHIL